MAQNVTIHQVIEVDVDLIKPDPENPNVMTQEQIAGLRKSLTEYGVLQPVIIDQNYVAIDGHNRFAELKALGLKKVPAVQVTVNETQRRLIRQAMNKLHGMHDLEKDIAELRRIMEAGSEEALKLQDILGINEDVLKTMQANLEVSQQTNDGLDTSPRERHAETYLYGNIKQITLYYTNPEYSGLEPIMQKVIQEEKIEDNTQLFTRALKLYYEQKYGAWPDNAPTGFESAPAESLPVEGSGAPVETN